VSYRPWVQTRALPAEVLVVLVLVMGVAYVAWAPSVPDLAAQVARANLVRSEGVTSWWTGWFGGLSLPSYSVLVPSSMAAIGVRATGLLGVLFGALGAGRLVGGSIRPRAGAIVFAVAQMADLLDGRVTFCVGLAVGVWALLAVRSQRIVLGVVLAVGCYFASPLAGLFLGFVMVAVVAVFPLARWSAAAAGLALLLTGAVMALLFPGTGVMPFTWLDATPAVLCACGVMLACRQVTVRIVAGLVIVSALALLAVPSAVGDNITRLAWVCAVPIVVAYSRLSLTKLIPVILGLALWPVGDLVGQLGAGSTASASRAFYEPVQAEISALRSRAGSSVVGERVEVVDTANHWGSVYLSSLSLARGWDRQADVIDNPIFYQNGALSAATYRGWLRQLAVGWVAIPNASLDYAAVAEATLVRAGLPYLQRVWTNADWRVYRVVAASPLATGARVELVDSAGIVLDTTGASSVMLKTRWSAYLKVEDVVHHRVVPACITDDSGWVGLRIPRAESVFVTSQFSPAARVQHPDPDCVADLSGDTQ
jgi:hypothetical protein